MSEETQVINVRELLSQPTDSVERPKSLYEGHYHGTILGHVFDRSSKKQTPFVRFMVRINSPGDDIPEDENQGIDFSQKELRIDFYITPKALYRLSDMLDAVLGQQTGVSFDERIPSTQNTKVLVRVSRRLNDDGTDSGYNDIVSMVADE